MRDDVDDNDDDNDGDDDVDDNDGEVGRVPGLGGTWETRVGAISHQAFLCSLCKLSQSQCAGVGSMEIKRKGNTIGGVALLAMESNKPKNMKVKHFSLQSLELNCHLTPKSVFINNIYRDHQIALK